VTLDLKNLNVNLKRVSASEDDIGDYSALRSNLNEFIISFRWNRTRDLWRDSLERYRLSYNGLYTTSNQLNMCHILYLLACRIVYLVVYSTKVQYRFSVQLHFLYTG